MTKNKKNHRIDIRIILAVIFAIIVIEVTALINGIDGTLMAIVLFILGSLGGIAIPKEKIFKN